jgi:hypothetical protein
VLDGLRDDCEPGIGDTPIILITAFGDPHIHADATRLGAAVFEKPFDVDDLRDCATELIAPIGECDSPVPRRRWRGLTWMHTRRPDSP